MNNLIIENPERLSDSSFKITINGTDYEYEVSEEKDIDAVIDKLNTWLERGEDSYGGLYDYIKRTFKLVGEYEEPIPEPVEEIEDTEIELPSESVEVDEPIENQLDISLDIDEDEVQVQINDWSATFELVGEEEDFTDILAEYVNNEMSLNDRTMLMVQLAKTLEANDPVDFYNLFNLLLDTGVDIVNSFNEAEEEASTEDSLEPAPVETEEPIGPANESVEINSDNILKEDDMFTNDEDNETDEDKEVSDITLDSLIEDPELIDNLLTLDLSLFELTNKINKEKIYFIGGINNRGNKYSLSYTTEPPIELIDDFKRLKEMPVCLNNIEDLSTVYDYIDKLLDIWYNKKIIDVEDYNE